MMLTLIALSASAQQRQWETIAAVNAPITALYIDSDNTVYAGDALGTIYTIKNRIVVKKDTLPSLALGSQISDLVVVENKLWVANGKEVLRVLDLSTNSWSTLPLTGVKKIAKKGGVIVAADAYHPNYRSINNGKTWQQIDAQQLPPSNADLQDIAVTPDGEFYVAYQFWGLWKSTDSGATWHETRMRLHEDSLINASRIAATENNGIVINATDKNGGIIPTSKSGIYHSLDTGATWSLLRRSVPFGLPGAELVIELAADGDHLLAPIRLERGGIIESFDGGKTWRDHNEGLGADTMVSTIALRGDIAITATLGLMMYQLSTTNSVENELYNNQPPTLSVFPNPTQSAFTVNVNNPVIGNSEIVITDILGTRNLLWKGTLQEATPLSLRVELPQNISGIYTVIYLDSHGGTTTTSLSVVR